MDITEKDVQLSGLPIERFLSANGIDQETRQAVARIQAEQGAGSLRRRQFIERLPFMDNDIIEGLLSGKLQVADVHYYVTKSVEATTQVDMFKPDDTIAVGFCNVEKGKLFTDRPFLLNAIQLGYHTGNAAITSANVNLFTPLTLPAEVANGEWALRYDTGDVMSDMPILNAFTPGVYARNTSVPAMTEDTDASAQAAYTLYPSFGFNTGKPHGLYELDHPKLFKGGKRIEFIMKFGQALSSTHHAFKVGLIGTTVRKN